MKTGNYCIEHNARLTDDMFEMKLSGDTSAIKRAGQFVNIRLDGFFLRRPISVCDIDGDLMTLLYKVIGAGTAQMSAMAKGQSLDLLTGLGNGFDTAKGGASPAVIGGGAGVPPMFYLTRRLIDEGKSPTVILGFNTGRDVYYEREFRALGVPVHLCTADGTAGSKGLVTDALRGQAGGFDYTYSCGSALMLRAVYDAAQTEVQFSFDERMGCGFGACMGCTCKTKNGNKRLCVEGPVLERSEIIWQT